MVVFFVDLKVASEFLDLSTEEGNLDARRAGVFITGGELLYDV